MYSYFFFILALIVLHSYIRLYDSRFRMQSVFNFILHSIKNGLKEAYQSISRPDVKSCNKF